MKKLLIWLSLLLCVSPVLSQVTQSGSALGTHATTSNNTVYTIGGSTPTANCIVFILAYFQRETASTVQVPSVTAGAGFTWVQIGFETFNASNDFGLVLFRSMGPSPTATNPELTFPETQTQFRGQFLEFCNVDTTGSNGAGAVVQVVSTECSSCTTVTSMMASFSHSSNASTGFFSTDNGVAGAGTGFTEIEFISERSDSEWKAANDTSIDGTSSASADMVMFGVEIKAAASSGASVGARGSRMGFTF